MNGSNWWIYRWGHSFTWRLTLLLAHASPILPSISRRKRTAPHSGRSGHRQPGMTRHRGWMMSRHDAWRWNHRCRRRLSGHRVDHVGQSLDAFVVGPGFQSGVGRKDRLADRRRRGKRSAKWLVSGKIDADSIWKYITVYTVDISISLSKGNRCNI